MTNIAAGEDTDMSCDTTTRYFSGLDLGQPHEPTALAILEQTRTGDVNKPYSTVKHYAVRHLERFAVGTPYTAIAARLAAMFAEPPLTHSTLTVDLTVVGRPVLTMLQRSGIEASIRPVTVAMSQAAKMADVGDTHVPRKELASCVQVLLQTRRIKVASSLAEAALLVRELETFRVKVPTAQGDDFETWREGPQDDMVLAVAIAAWQAENQLEFWFLS